MPSKKRKIRNWANWRENLHEIIFEADTPAGKFFDVALLIFILLSILVVMLESVNEIQQRYAEYFAIAEWVFTIFFTIEYILRLLCVYKPMRYATSFFGVVDLLSILPTYLSLLFPVSGSLMAVRALRLIRIFRIFKLGGFLNEGAVIISALKESRAKITVFLTFIMLMVTVLGSVMYLVEGTADSGFTSIPRSIYWAIVTLTTVGYGDIAPVTELGQFIAAIIMIMGYGVLAVPTGIVSAEMVKQSNENTTTTQACKSCLMEGHDVDAKFCKYCGEEL
jgi:voltage-gated potassium channel